MLKEALRSRCFTVITQGYWISKDSYSGQTHLLVWRDHEILHIILRKVSRDSTSVALEFFEQR